MRASRVESTACVRRRDLDAQGLRTDAFQGVFFFQKSSVERRLKPKVERGYHLDAYATDDSRCDARTWSAARSSVRTPGFVADGWLAVAHQKSELSRKGRFAPLLTDIGC